MATLEQTLNQHRSLGEGVHSVTLKRNHGTEKALLEFGKRNKIMLTFANPMYVATYRVKGDVLTVAEVKPFWQEKERFQQATSECAAVVTLERSKLQAHGRFSKKVV